MRRFSSSLSVVTYHPASWGNLKDESPLAIDSPTYPFGARSHVYSRTLLVVTTSDLEDVTLEFITEGVAGNLNTSKKSQSACHSSNRRRLPILQSVVSNPLPISFPLPLICSFHKRQRAGTNFGSHALLHEGTELALVIDLDDLLRPIGRVGDVELHLDLTEAARSRQRRGLRFCRQVGDVFFKSSEFLSRAGGIFGACWCSEISAVWAAESYCARRFWGLVPGGRASYVSHPYRYRVNRHEDNKK